MAPQLLVEPYEVSESRIQQVIGILSDRGEFRVPVRRLRARWASKQERPGTNKWLSGEEPAGCLYLGRLETIGTAARKQIMIRKLYPPPWFTPSESESDTKPPEVGPLWNRFLSDILGTKYETSAVSI